MSTTNIDDLPNTEIEDLLINKLAIKNEDDSDDDEYKSKVLKSQIVVDFSISISERLRTIDDYYCTSGLEVVEILKRILSIYMFSTTLDVEDYICNICLHLTRLPISLRLETAKDLVFAKDTPKSVNVLQSLLSETITQQDDSIPIPIIVSSIYIFMLYCDEHDKSNAFDYFVSVLSNFKLSSEYRYKLITSLKIHLSENEKRLLFFEEKSFRIYLHNQKNSSIYRNLSGQILLIKYPNSSGNSECDLLSISEDENSTYNERADAADIVLRYGGTDEYKDIAKKIIKNLGAIEHGIESTRNIFYNNQNAHSEHIEKSAVEILKKLSSKLVLNDLTFDQVINNIQKYMDSTKCTAEDQKLDSTKCNGEQQKLDSTKCNGEQQKLDSTKCTAEDQKLDSTKCTAEEQQKLSEKFATTHDNVLITLHRISLDHALYSDLNLSLKHALVYVYTFITQYEKESDLMSRLIEELADSANICSTGILERIVNTLTGYIEYGVGIGFEEEINASLSGRLNYKIRNIPTMKCLHTSHSKQFCNCILQKSFLDYNPNQDSSCFHQRVCNEKCTFNEDLMNDVLEQLIIPTHKYNSRTRFLMFFRHIISEIMEELRNDYKDLIDIPTFDLYFKKALILYEGQ